MAKTIRLIAAGVVFNNQRQILLIRNAVLSGQARPWTEKWSLPGGGVRFGESLEDAFRREVHEETKVTIKHVLGQLPLQEAIFAIEDTIVHYVFANFVASTASCLLRPGDDVCEAAWRSFDQLDETFIYPQVLETVRSAWHLYTARATPEPSI